MALPAAMAMCCVPTSLTFVAILAPIFLGIVWFVAKRLAGRWIRRIAHLVGFGLTTLFLGVLVGEILDHWLFPRGSLHD